MCFCFPALTNLCIARSVHITKTIFSARITNCGRMRPEQIRSENSKHCFVHMRPELLVFRGGRLRELCLRFAILCFWGGRQPELCLQFAS